MNELLRKVKKAPDINKRFDEVLHGDIKKTEVITFVNPYSYLLLRDEVSIIENIDAIYTDAISSAKYLSYLFKQKVPRVSFDQSSFANDFLERADREGFSIFLLGTKEKELNKAISNFKAHYKNINIVGSHDGYFDDDEKMIESILSTNPDFVICGMGTPRQDNFAVKLKLRSSGIIKQIYTCGGFLHQSAESLVYYPQWIDKLHLRWLYRVFENSYVIKRLLGSYPKFFFLVLKDLKS
ncbi:UDP-Gal:alpha-D-GlcNAc-diphosphoundecaprenol beta-1,4-galactosyltransferase [Pseudoalteromonas holothuriae]|uniref:UDP-Gal:alpha-D-GlcNAc-diphosphoundecaprenol beta-1,4-galactosyltransferase n=1 Tax=Pseudoalteromonas holothuriae TaxID=2963714 RepID=A0A9W4QWR8_9GAMM|nr:MULTISPECIES: WecB/TagA/CpsF family glycosyltransferase [unclassified Pseudoalteromonas]CAH9052808.1 UDP-Gal:alpha-D-GlcNAc-diphosphoundecaprenol beta-1,4-galactosyltransferase [Pseudoalteromonas sp. CIP111951]CAH9056720.1 UDP-Gal:alpha-D-GlcNAc-diphosphoundecaprenol beta-1,4-galactosyltransferase [Pseudoalteromonas sp. CIP111854]